MANSREIEREQIASMKKKIEQMQKRVREKEKKLSDKERTNRNVRLYQAAGRLEQIIHEGGFPDFELSYPKTSGKTYRDLDDTVTILGEVALRMLREGRELKKETPWQKKQRKEQEDHNEHSNDI